MTNILAGATTFLTLNRTSQIFFPLSNDHQYVTTIRHDLAIVEVANEDVESLLHRRCGCCDQTYVCFHISSEAEIALWRSPE